METEIIEALREQNEEYRKLYEEHKKLEEALAEIDKSKYITADEGLKRKEIQKQKLLKKDRMAEIIREYKKGKKS
ncbi:DUF465 domain-containing protein [bacterium]|nr:MAG: DUF465 domain-containing protein [bacterium]